MSLQQELPKELSINILRPFGPRMLHTNIPEQFVNKLNAQCDEILKSEEERKEKDASGDLVGHVVEELACDIDKIENFGSALYSLTNALYTNFLTERNEMTEKNKPDKLAIHNCWFVRSFKHDYNPTHIHTNGNYSCVLYLKVPDSISEKNTKNTKKGYATEGYIDFIYGSSTVVSPGNLCCKPAVGDIYIFPSFLFHTVYPFYGEGERRTFSANMSLTKNEDNE